MIHTSAKYPYLHTPVHAAMYVSVVRALRGGPVRAVRAAEASEPLLIRGRVVGLDVTAQTRFYSSRIITLLAA